MCFLCLFEFQIELFYCFTVRDFIEFYFSFFDFIDRVFYSEKFLNKCDVCELV